jgi:hypothetical protein
MDNLTQQQSERQGIKMNTTELDLLVNLRATTLAEIKFNEKMKEFNAVNPNTNKIAVFHSFTEAELQGRRKEVYEAICMFPNLDRHELHEALESIYGAYSFTGMGARVTELIQSGLVQVVGIKTSEITKKTVSIFAKVA